MQILRTVTFTVALASALSAQITSLPYVEDFETSDGGFTTGGTNNSWAWGIPTGSFLRGASSGTRAFATNLNGVYNNSENSYVESPVFDLTGLTSDATLQFQQIFETESCCDEWWVEVSYDGGTFTKLGTANSSNAINWYNNTFGNYWNGTSGNAGAWRTARHPLPGSAGTTMQLRWVFSTDGSSVRDGLGIDDVQVFEQLLDVGTVSIDAPLSGQQFQANTVVVATLENLGTTAAGNFPIRLDVNGPTGTVTATEMMPFTISPLSELPFFFATTVDMTTPGTYSITVTTQLAGDSNPGNDSITEQVIAQGTVTSFPWFEDFESGPGDFITSGANSTWANGTPTGNFITGAASGSNAWVTNLTGPYAAGEESYLTTPPLDCSGMTQDPFVQFSHIFQLDTSDRHTMEVSINGGPFSRLGSAGDPGALNWYGGGIFNGNFWERSSGNFGVWRTARHLIPGAAGNVIQLRWFLDNNQTFSLNEDGVGIDNVLVYEAQFGQGQPASSLAQLDVNDAVEVLGFPVTSAIPGPYFTAVSATQDTLDISFSGAPLQAIALLGGTLNVGAIPYPVGQIDVFPFQIWAAGYEQGGLNPLFFTNSQGVMNLSVTIPLGLVGQVITFQGVLAGAETFALTNAVQVAFLP